MRKIFNNGKILLPISGRGFLGENLFARLCKCVSVCVSNACVCMCVFAFYGAYTQCELDKYTYRSTCAYISYSRLESTGRRLRLELRPLPFSPRQPNPRNFSLRACRKRDRAQQDPEPRPRLPPPRPATNRSCKFVPRQ